MEHFNVGYTIVSSLVESLQKICRIESLRTNNAQYATYVYTAETQYLKFCLDHSSLPQELSETNYADFMNLIVLFHKPRCHILNSYTQYSFFN
jgi:hypothetical protein